PTGAATSPTRAFTFSAPGETGATFQCRVDAAAFAACTSPYTTPSLANGSHTFEVRTLDTAGNPDPTPASRTFTITATPPSAPVFVSPGQDVLLTTSTFALSGTAEAGTTVEVFEGAVSKGVASASDGTWTLTLSNVPDGEHSYTARATSPAGTSTASPNRTVRVQNAAPPAAPSVAGGPEGTQAAAFTFSSAESGTSFECSLDDGPFTACTSPKEYTGLPAGEHTFRVRAVAAGRGAGEPSSRSFFVAAPQPEATTTPVPSASPSPTPSATPTPAPTPTFKKDVVAAPASGTIQVCDKPGGRCHTLAPGEEIPLNQTIDARKGVVVLSSVAADGTVQTAKFYDGMFKVSQSATTTDLTLNEPLAPCSKQKASSSAAKPKTRKLWGDGKGKFRTKGTYSAATVRGTKWLVQDSCAGTLTQVKVGVVSVRDDVTHKTITLRAGKRYTAKPR
ncbi:MAG: hypothetical protein QOF43_852, partial [Gaiellaceae bacterium]|nr:hypothetical protein [Gaiellaceae bacterium]